MPPLGKLTDPGNRLSFHAANLTADAGWDAAVEGCDYVLHVASPLGVAEPKDPNVLITPAREGAKRAVGAAIKHGVKRVVMTSSVAATSKGRRLQPATGSATRPSGRGPDRRRSSAPTPCPRPWPSAPPGT